MAFIFHVLDEFVCTSFVTVEICQGFICFATRFFDGPFRAACQVVILAPFAGLVRIVFGEYALQFRDMTLMIFNIDDMYPLLSTASAGLAFPQVLISARRSKSVERSGRKRFDGVRGIVFAVEPATWISHSSVF